MLVGSIAAWWRLTLPARHAGLGGIGDKGRRVGRGAGSVRAVNADGPPSAAHLKAEARAALAIGRAAEADRALARAAEVDPADPEPWRLRLERLRVLDLPLEAQRLGWQAFDAVAPASRQSILAN